jgi:hypothetical protein
MKNIIVSLFVIILFSLAGCDDNTPAPSPNPEPEVPDFSYNDMAKMYLSFKPESKWIFQDDSTLTLDTLVLYSTQDEIRKQNPGTTAEYTYLATWKYFSNNNIGLLKGESFAMNTAVPNNVSNSAERIYFAEDSYKIAFGPMYPFGNRITFGGEEGTFINKEKIASMELNGKTYTDVYHSISEDYNDYPGDTVFYHFYYAKNFGLIKFSYNHKGSGHSYSLVDASLITGD